MSQTHEEEKVVTIKLEEYQDLLSCKKAIEDIVTEVSSSENMVGPKVCHHYSAPKSEASITEKITWFKAYFNASRKILLEFHTVKKKVFDRHSKKSDKVQNNKSCQDDNTVNESIDNNTNTNNIVNDVDLNVCNDENNRQLQSLYNEYNDTVDKLNKHLQELKELEQSNQEFSTTRIKIKFKMIFSREPVTVAMEI